MEPMLAVHLENLLFLLLLVVAGLFQLLGRVARKVSGDAAKTASKAVPRSARPIPRAGPESDEERIRKFLEALGNPPASPPPPRTAQRPTYRKPLVLPRVPPIASPLPPLITRPPDLPSEFEVHREPIPIPAEQPRAAQESDEERIRKFLEALGNPPASPPPPRTAQRPTYRKPLVLPRVPPIASPLPPLITRPPDLPSEFEVHREPIPIPAEQPRAAQRSTEPVFQVHESTAPIVPAPTQPATTAHEITAQPQVVVPRRAIVTATLLRSKSSLREAIILREILGPPRGLQAPDATP
ncbi:MAG: hypothetical protein DME33_02715 [Verrucomicrobia bacterium]|nr:MAG: hypothetical protein DME33_02715 [Verrucomicrobiota bacterium]